VKALPQSKSPDAISRRGPALIVFIVTFLAFSRALQCDFVCDDWIVLVNNIHLNPPRWGSLGYYWTHIAWNLYMPVTCMTWGILVRFAYVAQGDQYGNHLNPAVFHLVQVLLHAATAVAAYRLLQRMTARRWAAAAGALLFAVHPIQAEAVCYIGALNNPLFGFFSILALTDYLDAVAPGGVQTARYWRGLLFLIIALLCKPAAVVVPPIAAILDWAVHRRPLLCVCKSILSWLVAVVPCLVWTKMFQAGATAANYARPAFRPVVALDAVGFYVWKILVPIHLAADYGRSPALLYAHLWMATLGLVAVALLLCAWLVRRRFPILAAAILIFMIALAPNSGLAPFDFQQYSTVADRYAYLAMLGPAMLAAWALSRPAASQGLAIAAISGLLIVAISLRTWQQAGYWQNDRALFGHAVEVNPGSWMAHENLAFGLMRTDPAAAAKESEKSIAINPDYRAAYVMLSYANLGLGNLPEALKQARIAAAMGPKDLQANKLLARLLDASGDQAGAISRYEQCLSLDDEDAQTHCDLAAALADMGNLPAAIAHYRIALQIDPHLSAAQEGLARAQRQLQRGRA
jgi:tetratricopeptide (TPR) repeat protein